MINSLENLLHFQSVFLINLGNLLQIPMADTFRSEGKIYVVVAVVLIVLVGLFAALFFIDRKIKKVEDELNNRKS